MSEFTLNYHPFYTDNIDEWGKYRLVFTGGSAYLEEYLYRYSDAETEVDFNKRKKVTYKPNHAKRAILKIRDAVFQRMVDVTRIGGPKSYINAVSGSNGGVNKRGMSIGAYIGLTILPELLSMGRAFIFVDKQSITPSYEGKITVADAEGKVPYLNMFRTEDVISWVPGEPNSEHEFMSVMLREWAYKNDDNGMPCGSIQKYRKVYIENDKVFVQYYDSKMIAEPSPIELSISRIPLVKFEITESLMTDIADYQIALLNLVSADMQYLLSANTGVYVEQYDPRWEAAFVRDGNPNEVASSDLKDSNGNVIVSQGQGTQTGLAAQAERSDNKKIVLGYKKARRYTTANAPEFIHPSTDPVIASMKKQDQLIADIERLVNLKVENLSITGEAKKQDRSGLESGLSTIGLVLQTGENQIADYWAEYEGEKKAIVTYPSDYSLKTDGDRIKDANELIPLKSAVPSLEFSRQISKRIARTMFDGKITPEIQKKIDAEIDNAKYTTSDPVTLTSAHQEGAIDAATMAEALGFSNPVELAAKAQKEQVDRLAAIALHQQANMGARGVADMQTHANAGKDEKLVNKQTPTQDVAPGLKGN